MNQQEFDTKVSDILVAGTEFVETWEKIGKLFLSLESGDKVLAFKSELLKNWMDAHEKQLTNHIMSK